jgi:hypothetical protein
VSDKNMKKLALAAIALGFSIGANAACDTKSLKGDYYFSASGIDNGYTCANLGVANFDGKGTMKTHTVYGCGSQTFESDMVSVYQLKSNCMGSAVGSNGFTYSLVMNKALTSGNFFASQNGAIGVGTMIKQ